VQKGQSTRTLTAKLEERFRVSQSRAKLIATDQVGTLNAKITQERQTSLGIEEYTWSSSDDERVRPLHQQLDDTVRRWDDPHPTEGHPGEPIGCRCSAIPVIRRERGDRLLALLRM
jgi:SPP1 gp7 family putative phage head morphogenesis protein